MFNTSLSVECKAYLITAFGGFSRKGISIIPTIHVVIVELQGDVKMGKQHRESARMNYSK